MIETKEEEKIIENYIIKKNKEEIKRKGKKKENKRSRVCGPTFMPFSKLFFDFSVFDTLISIHN